jgi:ribosomal protein L11 methyltransferase
MNSHFSPNICYGRFCNKKLLFSSMTLWHSQWELFAPNFYDGKAHVDLSPYGSATTLQLVPGPGFGDFSHPTTRLMLKLIAPSVLHQNVIDIGCGSGILSLAASLLGAKSVYGYDIDPSAVSHARQNSAANKCRIEFEQTPPPKTPPNALLLMNMISSEQAAAWEAFTPSLTPPARLLTSGVLDKESYLSWAEQNGWRVVQAVEEEGWWAFEFGCVLCT